MKPAPNLIVVHQNRDDRWIISREKNGWDERKGGTQYYRVRSQLKTGGDHATWRCALSWAQAHQRRMESLGYKAVKIVVDRTETSKLRVLP